MSKQLDDILRQTPAAIRQDAPKLNTGHAKDVGLSVMVPESIKRAVQVKCATEGLTLRQIVLTGLQAIGIDVPDAEITDRRK